MREGLELVSGRELTRRAFPTWGGRSAHIVVMQLVVIYGGCNFCLRLAAGVQDSYEPAVPAPCDSGGHRQCLEVAERRATVVPEWQAEVFGLPPLAAPRRARVQYLPRRLLEAPTAGSVVLLWSGLGMTGGVRV